MRDWQHRNVLLLTTDNDFTGPGPTDQTDMTTGAVIKLDRSEVCETVHTVAVIVRWIVYYRMVWYGATWQQLIS